MAIYKTLCEYEHEISICADCDLDECYGQEDERCPIYKLNLLAD
jgi:hypothetical protein